TAIYKLEATSWQPICTGGSAPAPVHGTGFAYDRVHRRAVVVGGANDRAGPMPSAQVVACDVRTGAWTTLPALATPRAYSHLVADDSSGLVLFGGYDANQNYLTDTLYSTNGGASWTSIAQVPVALGIGGNG